MNEQKDCLHFLIKRIDIDKDHLSDAGWNTGEIIAYYAKEYELGNILHVEDSKGWQEKFFTSATAAINTLNASDIVLRLFTDYCIKNNIPVLYPFDMGWGAAVIISNSSTLLNIAKKTKTGNYNDDIRAYIGRYVSFWSHQTPASLLLNNNPVFSNTLMLQISLYVVAVIASGKPVKPFPDMYYCLCNPGKRI